MIVAAIDIGSNSVRLLVRDGDTVLARDAAVTGLARGVDRSGRLSDASVAGTLDVISRYRARIDELGARRIHAVATSATRDAANGAEAMRSVGSVLGVEPEIISGEREASLSFRGATSGLEPAVRRIVVDVGGGSTEIIEGAESISWGFSYDIGSVRLTDRILVARPAPESEVRAAVSEVDRVLSIPTVAARGRSIIGVAGTFTSLAAIHLELDRYDPDRVHGTEMSRDDIDQLVRILASLDIDQTARIPSLDSGRAPVILAGAVVASRVMEIVGAHTVTVRERDLLDGVAAEIAGA